MICKGEFKLHLCPAPEALNRVSLLHLCFCSASVPEQSQLFLSCLEILKQISPGGRKKTQQPTKKHVEIVCEKSLESAISIRLESPRAEQSQANEPWSNPYLVKTFPQVMVMELPPLLSMAVRKKGCVRLSFPLLA